MIDRFPDMLRAAAELLRAADGAGLPARDGRVVDDDTNDDEPRAPAKRSFLATLTPIVQMVASSLAGGAPAADPPLVTNASDDDNDTTN